MYCRVLVTDLGIQVNKLYLIKIPFTCLQETKNIFISILRNVSVEKKFYSCTASTVHISLRLVSS